MRIQNRKLSDIKPYDGNPRQNEQAIAVVAESIKQFGVRQPIVVDKDGVILAGHTRFYAATELGLETFPVHVARELTEEQARLYRIADNRTADYADWDYTKLRDELAKLGESLGDIDLHGLGITEADWLELVIPDFEALAVDSDKSAGVRSDLLSVGKYRIAMTAAELDAFCGALDEYSTESGTLFGFVRWLMGKAGIECREEVQNVEGPSIPVI